MYPANVTFCLRYSLGGKRMWEQLSVSTYKEAQAESLRRLGDLITEKCEETSIGAKISKILALPAARPKSEPKPMAKPGEPMLDVAMDKYLENVATKSPRTSKGYRYTLSSSMPLRAISSFLRSLRSSSTTSSHTYAARVLEIALSTIALVKW